MAGAPLWYCLLAYLILIVIPAPTLLHGLRTPIVIPAKAGIHVDFKVMDGRPSKLRPTASFSRLRGNDSI